jgi:hypothetical protein
VAEGDAPSVAGAWARSTADGQSSGAVYLEITSSVEAAVVGRAWPGQQVGADRHVDVPAVDGQRDDGLHDLIAGVGSGRAARHHPVAR